MIFQAKEEIKIIQITLVLSKEGEILVHSSYSDLQFGDMKFSSALEAIKDSAMKLDEGTAAFAADDFQILVYRLKQVAAALIFDKDEDAESIQSWKSVAKEIASSFPKQLGNQEKQKMLEFKTTMDDIVQWHIKEQAPIDKLKEAFW